MLDARGMNGSSRAAGSKASAEVKDRGWSNARTSTRAKGRTHPRGRVAVTTLADGGLVVPSAGRFFGADGRTLRDPQALYAPGGGTILRSGAFNSPPMYHLRPDMLGAEQVERPYEESPWLRAGVKAIASGFASLPIQLWTGPPRDERSREFTEAEHPVLRLLRRPNPVQTEWEFKRAHATNMKLDGESLMFLADANGAPVSCNEESGTLTAMPEMIILARGSQVEHKTDDHGVITHWRFSYSNNKRTPPWPACAVVHFNDYDPYEPVRGLGDAQALTSNIDLYFQQERYVNAVLRNGGDPGAWIVFDEMLSGEELDRRQAEADEEYELANRGRYKVVGRGAKVTPNQLAPRDMEYLSGLAWSRDVTLAVLGVPPPVVGVYDDATYNNIERAVKEMWCGANGIHASVVVPTQDSLQHKLLRRLSGVLSPAQAEARVVFDLSGVEALQEAQDDRVELARKVAAAGVGVSFNEALAVAGAQVDPAEGGDEPLLASTFREVGPASTARQATAGADVDSRAHSRGGEACVDQAQAQEYSRTTAPRRRTGQSKRSKARKPRVNKKLARGVLKWLKEYEAAQLRKLRTFAKTGKAPAGHPTKRAEFSTRLLESLLLNEDRWTQALESDVEPGIEEATKDALRATKASLPRGPFLTITDPLVLDQMTAQRMVLSQAVGATTRERVRKALLRVMSDADSGKSLQEVVKRELPALTKELKRVFGTKEARAAAIAQTETATAENTTTYAQFKKSRVTKVRWLSSKDDDVRDTHATNASLGDHPFGEPFPNGLQHPHQPGAPASEVVNCRCEIIATAFADEDDE